MGSLLNVTGLTVRYPTRFGTFTAIEGLDLSLEPGEIHGLVGESGAGKSTIGAAIIGLIQSPGYIAAGDVKLHGESLRSLSDAAYHKLRGAKISMIFQDPQTSLNPLLTIEDQLVETIRQHSDASYGDARERAIELLKETGLQDAEARLGEYPHQFSGGMRQRVVIALALCTNPDLIIADEPTTALDVAIQKQILALIRQLAQDRGVGFILITHDIGVIAEITDSVSVLRNGKLVEEGKTAQVLGEPRHDYTKALMAAVPRLDEKLDRFVNILADEPALATPELQWNVVGASEQFASDWLLKGERPTLADGPVLSVRDLDVTFYADRPFAWGKKQGTRALRDISLDVLPGQVLGVIGESGSGKSTLAKAVVGLVRPTAGSIDFNGAPLPLGRDRPRNHAARRKIQMVFQDPYSSLNNRRTIEEIISEPIRFFKLAKSRAEQRRIVASVLSLVEMPQRAMLKYPHQFSGGQRQRIAVARALVARPEFLICDEPTSALDVSIQAQILNLLKELQARFGLSILFISHDLAVVRQMSDQVAVLKNGQLIETGSAEDFFASPKADYSRQLLQETPSLALIARH
ncbi:dipeptide ABC transporter ATP-binding protein [Candidatus Halocynthiibacter alkanivorans]|uniref:dipeptide ABC transporter ATP-binding protein n=1 Tax=Candidatus Halocynthiibacter alkanivorans TaxID=2267619 RepID=UPI000DF1E9E1|nr:ABC transporter ATP-binding protein [Candidatus Halocynthiibacter alkanivorans]